MFNFIQNCLAGNALLEDIDDYIDEWHEGNSEEPIHVFLGMTVEEYTAWVVTPSILPYIVKAHKDNITYTDALSQASAMAARSNSINNNDKIVEWLKKKQLDYEW